MAENSWETFRKTDAEVLASFERITQSGNWSGTPNLNVNVLFAQGHGPELNLPLSEAKQHADLGPILGLAGAIVLRMMLVIQHVGGRVVVQRPADKNTDRITLGFNDNLAPKELAKLLTVVHAEFPTYARSESIDRLLGSELAEFYRAREAGLLRLEAMAQKLIQDTEAYRHRLDAQADARAAKLDERFAARSGELEVAARVQREAVEARSAELDAREKSLDDRASRHARRALRIDLQSALTERSKVFRLTGGTASKRFAVHALYVSLLVLLVSFVIFELRSSDTAGLIRVGLGAAATVAIFILYIRWTDQWFRQHADEEFRLKRMSLDVDRASWVVETAMEWEQQNKAPIPAQLLEQLSRDLFAGGPSSGPVRHPVEDLAAAVLSASSSLKVNLPGVGEATLNRRGVQRLHDAMGEGQPPGG